mmetsp:Transcript_26433/g.61688  ORF Transcript_26433/g.61688 Transcript_26433/m.61688 type:complete len:231 (-) Transcript_26433:2354-3046(-)
MTRRPPRTSPDSGEGRDDPVYVERDEHDVDEPHREEEGRRQPGCPRIASDLTAEREAAREEEGDGHHGEGGEEHDGEGEAGGGHEVLARAVGGVGVVDGGDEPGDAQPEEDVHRVGACDVAHGCVGELVVEDCQSARECVGQRGADCDESYGGDRIAQTDHTAEERGDLAHHSRPSADEADGDEEGRPAARPTHRRNERELQLPEESDGVHQRVEGGGGQLFASLVVDAA